MKHAIFLIVFFSFGLGAAAQDNFSFTPQKPRPGESVNISYTPPAGLFDAADVVNCVAYKWGTYCDGTAQAKVKMCKPVTVLLKKNGNHYEGSMSTDTVTRLLTFSFTSGNVQWKSEKSGPVLVSGKADTVQNLGYCIPFYTADGKICQFTSFMNAVYLVIRQPYTLFITNNKKAEDLLLKEQQLYPDAKYYTLSWLINLYYNQNENDKARALFLKESDKLYASGLSSERDLELLAFFGIRQGVNYQFSYFMRQVAEKVKSKGGLSPFDEAYKGEKDLAKKSDMIAELVSTYNKVGFAERIVPMLSPPDQYPVNLFLEVFRSADKAAFRAYADKFNFLRGVTHSIPSEIYTAQMALDTLKTVDLGVAEKFILDRYAIYSDLASKLQKGIPFEPLKGDDYYTAEENADAINITATFFADQAVQVYTQKGDDKTAWKYAKEARQYLQRIKVGYGDAFAINTHYSLLAEKFLPAKQYRPEIEKMIREGAWKPDMMEVLKRLWVKEKKSEDGFEDYAASLRQGEVENAKKTLLATQLNYAAPQFALKDLDGNMVKLEDLKGKTVILDFWATWCAPCKASFPGMQKLVTAYKDDPNVRFLFIDTWEHVRGGENKTVEERNQAVADYIKEKKYSFQVLLDTEIAAGTAYKANSVPAKFIIDKNGIVRYNIMGFEANEGKLFDEMKAMIESLR